MMTGATAKRSIIVTNGPAESRRTLKPTSRIAAQKPSDLRAAAADSEKAAKALKEQAENEIKLLLGDAAIGTIDDRVVVRWTHIVQHRPDLDALRQRFPRTMARYVRESSHRRFYFPKERPTS